MTPDSIAAPGRPDTQRERPPEWARAKVPLSEKGGGAGGLRALSHWLRRVASVPTSLSLPRRSRYEHLVGSLNEVAAAISSTMSTEEVLSTVVDETKKLIGTDKAILCLLSSGGLGLSGDENGVFVRGRRDQYPETWWRAQLGEAAANAIRRRAPVVDIRGGAWLVTVPITVRSRPIGVLSAINPITRRFSDDQIALMAVLGAFAGTAVENARLHSQSHYALLADERRRIAKEMHDGLSQSLFSASLEIDVCRKRLHSDPQDVCGRLDRVQAIVVRSLTELRRYIYDLRPVSLSKLGLVGAIEMRVQEIAGANDLSIRVYVEGQERPLPPGVESCIYRVAQEATSNVAKHARANRAVLVLTYRPSGIEFLIEDDGRGFDVGRASERADNDECMGLRSMRDRVFAEGGSFQVISDNRGTSLMADMPC